MVRHVLAIVLLLSAVGAPVASAADTPLEPPSLVSPAAQEAAVDGLAQRPAAGAGQRRPAGSPIAQPSPVADQRTTAALLDVTVSDLAVESHGTYALVTFTTSRPVRAGVAYAPGPVTVARPVPGAPAVSHLPAGPPAPPPVGPPTSGTQGFTGFVSPLGTSHTLRLDGLASNTVYHAEAWVEGDGQQRAWSDFQTFRTLKRRLKITFDEAHIFDSGDLIGDGEPTWFFTARWDTTGDAGVLLVDGCFPYTADPPDAQGDARSLCLQGDTGQASTITDPSDGGRVLPFATPAGQPLALVFAEENFGGRLPDRISIVSWAKEDDSDLGILDELGRCFAFQCGSFDASGLPWLHWQVPDGELSVDQIRLHANASRDEGFRSDVLATLTVYYDDRVYTGYTGGGQVVSTFPIGSTLRIHR